MYNKRIALCERSGNIKSLSRRLGVTPFAHKRQSGVVLIVALIMLMLLTLVGITGIQTTSLEEKMAGNMRDKNLAFQSAESALTAAEKSLDVFASVPTFSNNGGTSVNSGFYTTAATIPTSSNTTATCPYISIQDDCFWTTNPKATSSVSTLGNGIDAPYYIIQDLGCTPTANCCTPPAACPAGWVPGSHYYRITVKATGATTNAVVVVQSIYSPPW